MPDLLAGLDDIDWSRVNHAYGPATDVPIQLRALTSQSAGEREAAMRELWGNIHHQGTVYEAAAPAMPFLAALAAGPGPQPRGEILILMSALAHGHTYGDRRVEVELSWVAAARRAAESAAGSLASLLVHPDVRIRLPAIALCANFTSLHETVRAVCVSAALAARDDRLARLGYQLAGLIAGAELKDVLVAGDGTWAADVLDATDLTGDEEPDGLLNALQSPDRAEFVQELLEDIAGKITYRQRGQ